MKILVTTSNKHISLLPPYSVLFNKYWPDQQVVFLGYDNPNVPKLPNNFSYVSLGQQPKTADWTTPIIPYINSLKDDYFVITVEDNILCGHVDTHKVEVLEKEIRLGNASKAMLDSHLNWNPRFFGRTHPYKEGMLKLDQHTQYRTSLSPAIWRKEYFLRYCKPNMTCWDFEIKNMPESRRDEAIIISLDQDEWLFKHMNVHVKGRPAPRFDQKLVWGSTSGVSKEDILFIYKHLPENVQQINKVHLDRLESGVLYH